MLKNFAKGSNVTLLDTIYLYPRKQENGKWDKGSITLIYKNLDSGEKYTETIDNPDYEFYFAKDDIEVEYNRLFIENDKVDKYSTPYVDLERTIAQLTGNMEFYNENLKMGNRRANKKLHTHPRVFMSDSNIEDHYRIRFNNLYKNESFPITKTFFDIETDIIDMKGDFPEMGECPVNAVTIICTHINKSFTLLLRNDKNKLIRDFENEVKKGTVFNELKSFVRNKVGGEVRERKFKLHELDYEFLFYDEEIQLIQDLFKIINFYKPDFTLAWNIAFDLPYLIERIKVLGYNPADIICHPDFKYKVADYIIDKRADVLSERGDYAKISSYSVYMDQMVQFASRRKGNNSFANFKLDYIGENIVGVKKLDYSDICLSLADLPYKDYKTFVFYNIMDTIVQQCIETQVNDIDYTFNKCLMSTTRYSKCHRQTVYLVNKASTEFYKNGFIIGNNINRENGAQPKFPGAQVADPLKLNDYSKIKIGNEDFQFPVYVFDNLDDYDYKSLYPNLERENNIAPNTQIGKIYIDEVVYKNENPFNNDLYDRGGAFIEDMQSKNYIIFGYRWLSLANYSEMYDDVVDYFTNVLLPFRQFNRYTENGLLNPIYRNSNNLLKNPICRGRRNAITKFHEKPDFQKVLDNVNISDCVYNDYKAI